MYNLIMEKEKIIEYLKSDGVELFKIADDVRKKYKGDEVHLRGLIEFSNICKNNCFYCGLRAENPFVERYKLSKEEIIKIAKMGFGLGYKTVVLQSGEGNFIKEKELCEVIEEIKKLDMALTLSIGEKTYEEYRAYKNAGADRFLLRIETTDKKLYEKLHPNMSFENRVECLYNLKELGYETGTGSLVGLPNQTIESLADDVLFFKKLDADMIGIGPFIPHPNTPLKNDGNKNAFDLALKLMAITRIIMPDINIPATTAMETLNPNGRIMALRSGANVVMPNITDINCKKKYEIYPNKPAVDVSIEKYKLELIEKLKLIGRFISDGYGYRK